MSNSLWIGTRIVSAVVLAAGCMSLKDGTALPQGSKTGTRRDPVSAAEDADVRPDSRTEDAAAPLPDSSHGPDIEPAVDAGKQPLGPAPKPEDDAAREDDAGHSEEGGLCPDRPTNQCSESTWPAGVIRYAIADNVEGRIAVRDAMNRWERATAGNSRFIEDSDAAAKVTFTACENGHRPVGYADCTNGCSVSLCRGSLHHTLGRVIGLWPEQRRSDRDHYVRVYQGCSMAAVTDRCGTPNNSSDFGPFDYDSAMFSFSDANAITRWNGQPLCANGCETDRPPSALDGSAVMERYQLDSGWSKFRRLSELTPPDPYIPGALTPLRDDTPNVEGYLPFWGKIAPNASPALESWTGEAIALYVRGADDTILKSWREANAAKWKYTEALPVPPGNGEVSDPAVVSPRDFRNDVVVRRGSAVFIMTGTETVVTNWQSLGAPAAGAVSSPAITSWGESRLDIVITARDGRVYHKFCSAQCQGNSGTWTEWSALPSATVRGKPAIVSRGPNSLDVFAHRPDGRIWTIAYAAGAWGTWSELPVEVPLHWDDACPDCNSPAVGATTSAVMDVYVRGADDRLWSATWNQTIGWTEFVPRGGLLLSSPAASSKTRDAGQGEVAVVMAEDHSAGEPVRALWVKNFLRP